MSGVTEARYWFPAKQDSIRGGGDSVSQNRRRKRTLGGGRALDGRYALPLSVAV